jgi:hypothetical protein
MLEAQMKVMMILAVVFDIFSWRGVMIARYLQVKVLVKLCKTTNSQLKLASIYALSLPSSKFRPNLSVRG